MTVNVVQNALTEARWALDALLANKTTLEAVVDAANLMADALWQWWQPL